MLGKSQLCPTLTGTTAALSGARCLSQVLYWAFSLLPLADLKEKLNTDLIEKTHKESTS